jgi:hypothetical protein
MKKPFNKEFYEKFYRDFQIESIEPRRINFLSTQNPRKLILISELNDFQNLESQIDDDIELLDRINQKILNRFKIERINTFDGTVLDDYIAFLIVNRDLKNTIIKQKEFYKKRIKEITKELKKL